MAGFVNSWIEQYTTSPTPCIQNTIPSGGSGLSSCLLWLVVGLFVGSLTTDSKKKHA